MSSLSASTADGALCTSPGSSQSDEPTRGDKIGEALSVLLLLAVAMSTACMLWLALKVPVSAQDIKDASWLTYYTDTTYVTSVLGTCLELAVLLGGSLLSVAKNKLLPAFAGIVVSVFLSMTVLQTTQLRAGIATDSVRIGCFVWDSSECHSMLGLPADNTPSMYLPTAVTGRSTITVAPWYLRAQHRKATWASYMVATPVTAIYAAFHTDELNAKLAVQRAAVAKFRAAHNSHH